MALVCTRGHITRSNSSELIRAG